MIEWINRLRMVWRLGRYAYHWYLLAAADHVVSLRELAGLFAGLAEQVPWGDGLRIAVPATPTDILEEVNHLKLLKHHQTGQELTISPSRYPTDCPG